MFSRIKAASLIAAFASLTLSAPTPATENILANGDDLLGSHFGLPGNATFDYVVVGGGTAGLAIATRLAEDSSNLVAVIEAGSFYEIGNGNLSQIPVYGPAFSGKSPEDIAPLVDWAFLTTPQTVCWDSIGEQVSVTDAGLGTRQSARSLCSGEMPWWKLCSQLPVVSKTEHAIPSEMGRHCWRSKLYFR